MVKYKSKYPALGFYVDGELRKFNGGEYHTTDKDEIAVLDNLTDAVKEAEAKAPAKKAPAKSKSTAKEA